MKECSKGLLITNRFLRSTKFLELYKYFEEAAADNGIELVEMTNDALITPQRIEAAAKEFDFCLFWDKDIVLANALEEAGLRCLNSSEAIEIADDKVLTFMKVKNLEIQIPQTIIFPFTYENIGYTDISFLELIGQELSYPYVLKEAQGSFGQQVYLVESREAATELLQTVKSKRLLAQSFIKESCGRDVRVQMVGDKAVAAMERFNDKDFRANITNGGSMRPHTVSEQELLLCQRIMKGIGLDFAGVDILYGKNGPVFCEVNSNAHFKNIHDCTGVNVAVDIMKYIKDSL